ncbi:dihydropteroate synthase [Brachybacterium huguangmaarense]
MGILNVTPDSFSDGGEHDTPEGAIAHARALVAAGADIIDVGGESTRPGAARVAPDEEARRVLPVVRALAAEGICVSIDTMRAEVAAEAVAAGAVIVNDVSGGLADPAMGATAARARTVLGAPPVVVAMHWRAHSATMNALAEYDDTARDVARELGAAIEALEAAGVERSRLVADPGLGFAKDATHNWELLARWDDLAGLGLPILIGASRKRFTAALGQDRDDVTAAITAYSALRGAWCVRVHDAPASAAAVRTVEAIAGHAR